MRADTHVYVAARLPHVKPQNLVCAHHVAHRFSMYTNARANQRRTT